MLELQFDNVKQPVRLVPVADGCPALRGEDELTSKDPSLVELAHQIADGRATGNLQFFVVLLTLAALAALVVWFLAPYLNERGKLLAAAETVGRRLDEIRQATELSEQIKARISHGDWTVKEYKILRRQKLEQLLAAAYNVQVFSNSDSTIDRTQVSLTLESKKHIVDFELLSVLYFPELSSESTALVRVHTELSRWLVSKRSTLAQGSLQLEYEEKIFERIRSLPNSHGTGLTLEAQLAVVKAAHDRVVAIMSATVDEYGPHTAAMQRAVYAIELRAAALMTELIAPTES